LGSITCGTSSASATVVEEASSTSTPGSYTQSRIAVSSDETALSEGTAGTGSTATINVSFITILKTVGAIREQHESVIDDSIARCRVDVKNGFVMIFESSD